MLPQGWVWDLAPALRASGSRGEAGEGPEVQEDEAQTCGVDGKDWTSREGEHRKMFCCSLEGKEPPLAL